MNASAPPLPSSSRTESIEGPIIERIAGRINSLAVGIRTCFASKAFPDFLGPPLPHLA